MAKAVEGQCDQLQHHDERLPWPLAEVLGALCGSRQRFMGPGISGWFQTGFHGEFLKGFLNGMLL